MTWGIQIQWGGQWVTVQTGFKSRDDAEWATAGWKQQNQCYGDPFRAVEVSVVCPTDECVDLSATVPGNDPA